jgi:hypothetical protein
MMRFKIDNTAKLTKVTENAYLYPQVTSADEDLCLKAISRKWALPINKQKMGVTNNEEPSYKGNSEI